MKTRNCAKRSYASNTHEETDTGGGGDGESQGGAVGKNPAGEVRFVAKRTLHDIFYTDDWRFGCLF